MKKDKMEYQNLINDRPKQSVTMNHYVPPKPRKLISMPAQLVFGGRNSSNVSYWESLVIFLKSDEVEDIMQQVSILAIFIDVTGGGNAKVPIREESLKIPTPMFWSAS